MQITKDEFTQLILYIESKLEDQLELNNDKFVRDNMHTKIAIVGTLRTITVEDIIANTGIKKEKKKAVVTDNEDFEEFWKTYPASANFTHNGLTFTSSRILRSNKDICRGLYQKAINEGTPAESILQALKNQLQIIHKESYDSGQNKLQYFSAIETYLRQKKYEAFIDVNTTDTGEEVINTWA